MAYCSKCGQELREDDRFCPRCGAPVHTGPERTTEKKTEYWKYVLTAAVAVLAVAAVALLAVRLSGRPEPEPEPNAVLEESAVPSPSQTPVTPEAPAAVSAEPTPESTPEPTPEPTPESTPESSSPLDVLYAIEVNPDYVADSPWEPLAVCEDLDRDGVEEVLAVYEMKDGDTVRVVCDLWRLEELICQVGTWDLYTEVGGNSGSAGVAWQGDQAYLALMIQEPAGDSFNDYTRFIPWAGRDLDEAEIYLECHGTYGEEDSGRYILGDTRVSREDYEAREAEFLPLVYELNLLSGAGNDGVMTFETMKRVYAKTD